MQQGWKFGLQLSNDQKMFTLYILEIYSAIMRACITFILL